MENQLLGEIQYKIEETKFGVWKRFLYPTGRSYHEFKSHSSFFGLPLVHFTYGRCPETGRRKIAKGIIAVGRIACGFLAIGQLAVGLVPIGQAAIGLLFGIGQLSTGMFAVGQAAIGFYFGLGQFATGYIAIGQFAIGNYVLAQLGAGKFVNAMNQQDQTAIEFFKALIGFFR